MIVDVIRKAVIAKGLRRRSEGDVLISKRGHLLNWLIDLRQILLQRDVLKQIATLFWETHKDSGPIQLGGVETTGITILTAILMGAPEHRSEVTAFIVRKERKTSGRGNIIEGIITDAPIVLIDDTINSGNSAEKARLAIEMFGHRISALFAIVDFESESGKAWRKRHGVVVSSVLTLADLQLTAGRRTLQPPQRYRNLWRVGMPGGYPYFIVPKSTPLLVDERIFRGNDSGKMHAFDSNTGGILWEFATTGVSPRKGIWSSPAYHEGRLYFGAYNGTVYCLNASDGAELWTQPYGEWIGSSPLVVPRHELLYVGIEYQRPWAQGSIGALDAKTGKKVWEYQTKKLQHGSPAYWSAGDLIIWGTADHEMVAFDAAGGDVRWVFHTRRSVKYAPSICESRGIVGFASYDKSIYVLDAATGRQLGQWETGDVCYTTPLIVNNRLFCGSGDRHMYVIDLDRLAVIAKLDLGARVYSSPRVLDDRVIVGTNGGNIVEIEIQTLKVVGRLQLPDAITNAVAVTADCRRIFASTYMNHLYAFERL